MNSIVSMLGYTPKRIGVYKTASIAELPDDILLFQSLKSTFPEATLVWISSKDLKEIAKRFYADINEYMSCPNHSKFMYSNTSVGWFTEAMQQQKWDVIIQLDSYDSVLNNWIELWNPKLLIAYSQAGYHLSGRTLLFSPPEATCRDSVQLDILTKLGINARKKVFQFPWSESDKRTITNIHSELFQHIFVCIHLGDAATGAWPMCYYTMIAYLLADHGYSLVFIAEESHRTAIQEICQHVKSPTFSFLRENLNWSNLAYLINQSSLVIGDDKDIAQLAAHLAIPNAWLSTRSESLQNNECYPNLSLNIEEYQPIKEVIQKISSLLHLHQESYS